jgi:hypothetical protein
MNKIRKGYFKREASRKQHPIANTGRAGEARSFCEDRYGVLCEGNTCVALCHATCERRSAKRFIKANIFVRRKFTGRLLNCVLRGQ